MTTLEMRQAMAARLAATWPKPEQEAVLVGVTDDRVPTGARSVVKLAETESWQWELTYARGTSMVGKECKPGPIVASVLLRAQRDGERVAAVWLASPKATCSGCGAQKTPTAKGLIAKHKADGPAIAVDRDGQNDDCPGSGQVAKLNPITLADYVFSVAYVTGGPGWWTAHVPERVNVTQLRACLRGGVVSVMEALRATKTQTPQS